MAYLQKYVTTYQNLFTENSIICTQTFQPSSILCAFYAFFFSITHDARIQVWWPESRIFEKILILRVAIMTSYLANLVTRVALVQTTIEANLRKKHEHLTYEHIFSRTHCDNSWLNKHEWNRKKNPTSFHGSHIVPYIGAWSY